MTKVDIISGFLGAGKTTLIKKLLKEALQGEQVVLIENEFGEIGIDGGFLKEAGIEIREMNSGCICCSLVGDFTTSLREVLVQYHPDRIIIEPSGVGKLSDVIVAVQKAMEGQDVIMNSSVAVVDVLKCKMYMKNFGEFFNNQIESAGTVVLSRTGRCKADKLNQAIELIRGLNEKATVITTDWNQLDGAQILSTMEATGNLEEELLKEMMEAHEEHEHHHHYDENGVCSCGHHHDDEEEHEHHHHHHDDDEECCCGHHHHHDEDEEEHEHCHHHHHHDEDEEEHEHCHHHHHDEDEEEHEHCHHHHHDEDEEHEHHHHHYDENGVCSCGHHHDEEEEHHHHHHHEDGEECCCGHHHEHGHHHHHADDVFTSCGFESPKSFTAAELESILEAMADTDTYGVILRSKGMVPNAEGEDWLYFDMVPEEHEIRAGHAEVTGKIVVIGAKIKEDKLKALFGV